MILPFSPRWFSRLEASQIGFVQLASDQIACSTAAIFLWSKRNNQNQAIGFFRINQTPETNQLLMPEILHQLICSLSHDLHGFIHPRLCRISSINRRILVLSSICASVSTLPTCTLLLGVSICNQQFPAKRYLRGQCHQLKASGNFHLNQFCRETRKYVYSQPMYMYIYIYIIDYVCIWIYTILYWPKKKHMFQTRIIILTCIYSVLCTFWPLSFNTLFGGHYIYNSKKLKNNPDGENLSFHCVFGKAVFQLSSFYSRIVLCQFFMFSLFTTPEMFRNSSEMFPNFNFP